VWRGVVHDKPARFNTIAELRKAARAAMLLPVSAVGLAAVADAADFDHCFGSVNEKQPMIADPKTQFARASLKHFYVARTRPGEPIQAGENAHCGGPVESTNISLGLFGPGNPFHAGSL
jgi:hypothetical protein